MDELDESAKNPTVVKANSLIQAGYRLTLAEQRVLLGAIALIGKDDEPTDQTTYSVTANALADLSGSAAQQAYRELADAAQRLYRREVRIEGGANGEGQGPHGRVTMTRWVQSIYYVPDEGRIELRFSHDVLPYLSMLQREFTSYQLKHVATMRSTHGVRLYELLQQWRLAGAREIEIEDLRRMFGIEGRYKAIKDLKRYVIEPAVRDVNDCSDLHVEWGQRKAGRKVAAIQFQFQPKKKQQKPKQHVHQDQRDAEPSRPEHRLVKPAKQEGSGQGKPVAADDYLAEMRRIGKKNSNSY
jgi:plasmid replication initiation protein